VSVTTSNPIVLYDGVCGLCNHLNQFLLKRDRKNRLRFASLQSNFAEALLLRHGVDAKNLDTVYVVVDHGLPSERLLSRSDAIIYLLDELDGGWKLLATGRVLPKAFRDQLYTLIARNRYRAFGKHDSCMLPDPSQRDKFLEI
jgi:predicted DCC family thiol-disulfide oxidoreductase YuxK